ncbi:MAG: nicotinamide riboside transporter PnuC [Bacteroidales bacterium]|nr:nicotinamide riboside transporter PnuC [Bacteroidales bacterium]
MEEYLTKNWLEILGTITGLIYLWQELKVSIWLWLTGIIMPVIYTFVFYKNGLYADFGIQIYYIIAAIYGFVVWKLGKQNNKSEKIIHTPKKIYLFLFIAVICSLIAIYWILTHFTDSTVPFWDSLTTALSIVALWMLAKKHAEQWIVWFIVDLISSGLYFYKGIYFTSTLYLLYSIVAIYGYKKWCKMIII